MRWLTEPESPAATTTDLESASLGGDVSPNAPAKLRASQTERERSELPQIARQLQRTLGLRREVARRPHFCADTLFRITVTNGTDPATVSHVLQLYANTIGIGKVEFLGIAPHTNR